MRRAGSRLAEFFAEIEDGAAREGEAFFGLSGDDVAAQIAADYRLAQRIQDEERAAESRRRKQEADDAAYARLLSGEAPAAEAAEAAKAPPLLAASDSELARRLQSELDEDARRTRARQLAEDERIARQLLESEGMKEKKEKKRRREEEEAAAAADSSSSSTDDEDESAAVKVSKRAELVPVAVGAGAKFAGDAKSEVAKALEDTPVDAAMVGRSVAALCKAIKGLRLRLIVNREIKERFVACFYDLQERHGEGRENLICAFHGTAAHHLESIVDKGLLVPGKDGVRVEHGSAFGKGIYVTTQVSLARSFASMHGPGGKPSGVVFVCAVLLGNPFDFHNKKCHKITDRKRKQEGYDSNVVGGNHRVCVLFSEAQVLPIFACSFSTSKK